MLTYQELAKVATAALIHQPREQKGNLAWTRVRSHSTPLYLKAARQSGERCRMCSSPRRGYLRLRFSSRASYSAIPEVRLSMGEGQTDMLSYVSPAASSFGAARQAERAFWPPSSVAPRARVSTQHCGAWTRKSGVRACLAWWAAQLSGHATVAPGRSEARG